MSCSILNHFLSHLRSASFSKTRDANIYVNDSNSFPASSLTDLRLVITSSTTSGRLPPWASTISGKIPTSPVCLSTSGEISQSLITLKVKWCTTSPVGNSHLKNGSGTSHLSHFPGIRGHLLPTKSVT